MRIRFSGPAVFAGVVSTTVLIVASLPLAASAASAAAGLKFTFNGSLSGAVTMPASDCAAGTNGSGGQFGLYAKLKGMTSAAASYTITIVVPGGKLTTKGATGTINMQFIPMAHPLSGKSGKGNVHIKGTWNCAS